MQKFIRARVVNVVPEESWFLAFHAETRALLKIEGSRSIQFRLQGDDLVCEQRLGAELPMVNSEVALFLVETKNLPTRRAMVIKSEPDRGWGLAELVESEDKRTVFFHFTGGIVLIENSGTLSPTEPYPGEVAIPMPGSEILFEKLLPAVEGKSYAQVTGWIATERVKNAQMKTFSWIPSQQLEVMKERAERAAKTLVLLAESAKQRMEKMERHRAMRKQKPGKRKGEKEERKKERMSA